MVLAMQPSAPPGSMFVTAEGDVNLLCGACDRMLCRNLNSATEVAGVIFLCPTCGTYNLNADRD